MNGVDAARAIKKDQRTAHIPIVGWSAYFGELWREEALRAGMVAYMEKPLSVPVIEATINSVSRVRSLSLLFAPLSTVINRAAPLF